MQDDDYLKRLSSFEQAGAAMRPIAEMLYTYFSALTDCGFTRSEALQLVQTLQSHVWQLSLNIKTKEDEE
jgi:hypothetical protein